MPDCVYYTLCVQAAEEEEEEEGERQHETISITAQRRQRIVRHNPLVMLINTHTNPNLSKTDYLGVLEF